MSVPGALNAGHTVNSASWGPFSMGVPSSGCTVTASILEAESGAD